MTKMMAKKDELLDIWEFTMREKNASFMKSS